MTRRTYVVRWRRLTQPDELLECRGLTAERLVSRLRGSIRNSGPVIIDGVEIEPFPLDLARPGGE